jgi:hypothetical protein
MSEHPALESGGDGDHDYDDTEEQNWGAPLPNASGGDYGGEGEASSCSSSKRAITQPSLSRVRSQNSSVPGDSGFSATVGLVTRLAGRSNLKAPQLAPASRATRHTVAENPESPGTEEFCKRIRERLQGNEQEFGDLRGRLKLALSIEGEGYGKVTRNDAESLMKAVQFEEEFGCSYTDYLLRGCAGTIDAKPSTRITYGEDWTVISPDKNTDNKCKRLWKKLSFGKFRELLRILSQFLLADIGQAKLSAMSVIVRPKGARSGIIHNDCKMQPDGKYICDMWSHALQLVGISFWVPTLADKLGKYDYDYLNFFGYLIHTYSSSFSYGHSWAEASEPRVPVQGAI